MAEADPPRVRGLEAFPMEHDGRKVVVLRDPEGFCADTLAVPLPLFFIMTLLDGTRDRLEVQAEFARRTGAILPGEQLEEILADLDRRLLLDSAHFDEKRREAVEAFRKLEVRAAAHAGTAYEEEPAALGRQLEGWFGAPDGPGAAAGGAPAADSGLRAIVAPHIDPRRGGPCAARAFAALRGVPADALFVILGTDHTGLARFSATRKDFTTPLGRARTDAAFVDEVVARSGLDLGAGEYAHRKEHSVEFQVLFLQSVFGPGVRIAPFLCGSFHDLMRRRASLREDPEVAAFTSGLRAALEYAGRAVVIAGADLAHVGPRFGDEAALSDGFLAGVEAEDRAFLERVAAGDGEAVFGGVVAEQDRRRICGYPCITTTLLALPDLRGDLLGYGMARDDQVGSAVSYASVALV
jgi:AmmeMemoRadiSam system protein B